MFDLTVRQLGPPVGEREKNTVSKPGNSASWRQIMSDMGLERPVDDSVEQSLDVIADGTDPDEYSRPREVPLEANEADAAEQERALGHDEDDYR